METDQDNDKRLILCNGGQNLHITGVAQSCQEDNPAKILHIDQDFINIS
jgi:hypothetical protein